MPQMKSNPETRPANANLEHQQQSSDQPCLCHILTPVSSTASGTASFKHKLETQIVALSQLVSWTPVGRDNWIRGNRLEAGPVLRAGGQKELSRPHTNKQTSGGKQHSPWAIHSWGPLICGSGRAICWFARRRLGAVVGADLRATLHWKLWASYGQAMSKPRAALSKCLAFFVFSPHRAAAAAREAKLELGASWSLWNLVRIASMRETETESNLNGRQQSALGALHLRF